MTQPVNEPTTARSIGYGRWRTNQLERRPAPTPGNQTEVAHYFGWNYDTDNTVPDQTWTDVANLGTGGGFFEEIFYSPTDIEMGFDCGDGTFTTTVQAEYVFYGWVQFNEDVQIDNELRITAVHFGASDRIIQTNRLDIADGSIGELKFPVTAPRLLGSGSLFAALQCWQNSGGDLTIRDAEFWVRRFERVDTGSLELCIT